MMRCRNEGEKKRWSSLTPPLFLLYVTFRKYITHYDTFGQRPQRRHVGDMLIMFGDSFDSVKNEVAGWCNYLFSIASNLKWTRLNGHTNIPVCFSAPANKFDKSPPERTASIKGKRIAIDSEQNPPGQP